jgi:hypothetical protein
MLICVRSKFFFYIFSFPVSFYIFFWKKKKFVILWAIDNFKCHCQLEIVLNIAWVCSYLNCEERIIHKKYRIVKNTKYIYGWRNPTTTEQMLININGITNQDIIMNSFQKKNEKNERHTHKKKIIIFNMNWCYWVSSLKWIEMTNIFFLLFFFFLPCLAMAPREIER